MSNAWKWVLGIATAVLAVWILRLTVFAPDPIPVEIYPAAEGRVEETVSNTRAGSIRVPRRAVVSVDTPGRIVVLEAREGNEIVQGTPLIRVDDRPARATFDRATKELSSARADENALSIQCDLKRRDANRLTNLHKEGVISEEQADAARTASRQCDAELKAARERVALADAALTEAQVALDRTVVLAPFDGVVNQVLAEEGEYATPGTPVLDVMEREGMYVRAEIDEVDLARVREGLPVRVTLDPFRGQSFDGRVKRVAPFVSELEQQNRTLEVDVEFVDGVESLAAAKPGTSADVEIILQTRDGVLRVPSYALLKGDQLLLLENGTAVSRKVEVGLRNWDFAEIRSGLSPGEKVVLSLDREGVEEGAVLREELPEDN